MAMKPTVNEIREPYKMREKRSRPIWSVPKKKTLPGASTPNRWRSVGTSHSSLCLSPFAKSWIR
ncbi:hypothetical protein D3C87_1735670 [compost metagenome]